VRRVADDTERGEDQRQDEWGDLNREKALADLVNVHLSREVDAAEQNHRHRKGPEDTASPALPGALGKGLRAGRFDGFGRGVQGGGASLNAERATRATTLGGAARRGNDALAESAGRLGAGARSGVRTP
jgi:hypothetical protein